MKRNLAAAVRAEAEAAAVETDATVEAGDEAVIVEAEVAVAIGVAAETIAGSL